MARKPRKEKEAAIEMLVAHIQEFGAENLSEIRASFPQIPGATFSAWIAEAKAKAITNAPDIRAPSRAAMALSHPPLGQATVSGVNPLAIFAQFHRAYQTADKLEAFALDKDGKCRMPKVLALSANVRIRAASGEVAAVPILINAEKLRLLYETVVKVVGEASPELAQRIIEQLEEAERIAQRPAV
jgi:hypothetical protein